MTQCPSCMAATREEMKFCPSCGLALATPPPAELPLVPLRPNLTNSAGDVDREPRVEEDAEVLPSLGDEPVGESSKKISAKQIGIAILAVTAFVGLVVFQAVNTANTNASREAEQRRGEIVAEACETLVMDHLPAVSESEVQFHYAEGTTVKVKFLDVGGNQIGEVAACDYSVTDNTIYLEQIQWSAEFGGVPTEVTWDRATNLISIEKERAAPPQAESSTSCQDAFIRAASVPLSQDNNNEIALTTNACSDVDEWWAMLQRYPDVFGVTYFLESEKGLYVGSACLVGQNSPVCQDAAARGIGF